MADLPDDSEKKQLERLAERLERLAAEEHSFRMRRAAARGLSPEKALRSASASPAKLATRMDKLEKDAQRARRRNDDVGDFCCEWMVWVKSCGWRQGSERVAASRRQFFEAVEDLLPSWGEVAERKAVQEVSKAKEQLQALKARREEALQQLERSRRLGDEMRQIQAELLEHQEELPGLYQALAKDVINPGLMASRTPLEDVALRTPGSQGISQAATTAGGAALRTGPPSAPWPSAWPGPWYPFVPWSWAAPPGMPLGAVGGPPGWPATPPAPVAPQSQVPVPGSGPAATAEPQQQSAPKVIEQPTQAPVQPERPSAELTPQKASTAAAFSPVPSPSPSPQPQPTQSVAATPGSAKVQTPAESPKQAATEVSAKNAKNSSPPGEQAPLATSPVEIAPALVPGEPTSLPEAASTVEEPPSKAGENGAVVVCQGPQAGCGKVSSPKHVMRQVKLLLSCAATAPPPKPAELRGALRRAKTESWYAETISQLDATPDAAEAQLGGLLSTQRLAAALLLLKAHMASSGSSQAAKLAIAGPSEIRPGGDHAWQELLSLLPHWRGAMVKADFEAFCRISAEHLLPRFKADQVRRLSQILIELHPPVSASDASAPTKASPAQAAAEQQRMLSASSSMAATSSYRLRQMGGGTPSQQLGMARKSPSADLSSIIRRDPAWKMAVKTTESDFDEIADINDL